MKKLIFVITITIVLCSSLFAQSIPKASKFMVVNQKNENLSASEANWLPGAVRDKLEVNLQTYTDFLFVDATNISAVKKLQKQSESAGYNESDAIELGKLTVAKYAVFITIRKSNSGYTVGSDVTDLTTGQKLASVMSSARKTADELFSTTGCAADELTLKLCEKLGINLLNAQKYALMHGDEILSNDEQLKMAQEEEKAFKNAIAKYDAEIKRLSQSTDLSSTASKAKMEAEKALAQEKLKAAQEKAKRLEEEAKKAATDKAEDAARTEEQKKKRDQLAKEAAEKATAVRKTTVENESIFTKINVIESKKKAILDIQKSVDDRVAEIKKDGEDEFAKKKKEIMDAPYRAAEKNDDGTPSATAKERRERQVKNLREEIDNRVTKDSEEVMNVAGKNAIELYNEIKKDQQNISSVKTVSSFEDDLNVQISTFNGKTNAWKVTFWLYSNGIPVMNQSVNMTYKDLTGKEINTSSDNDYNEFIDTVDLYNSLFSRGDPVLTFNLRYSITSTDDYTSRYKIILLGVDVIETVSSKKKSILKFENSEFIKQITPIYNFQTELVRYALNKDDPAMRTLTVENAERILGWGWKTQKDIVIPNYVTAIGKSVFRDNETLVTVTIPKNVTYIGDWAFSGCKSLKTIELPSKVRAIGEVAFQGCGFTTLTIPDNVSSISNYAFNACSSLKDVVIPNSVTSIGESAFGYCVSLGNVTIPNSVQTIGRSAFQYCASLSKVDIGNSVTVIGKSAFYECQSIKKLTMGSNVLSIGEDAFYKCFSADAIVTIYTKNPPKLDRYEFTTNRKCSIYIPLEAMDSYRYSKEWSIHRDQFKPIE